jgi:hypothetical protein
MAGVIASISPVSGAPGTVITVSGSGFDAAARVGCPELVDTTFTNSGSLQATVPVSLDGPGGGSMIIVVYVQNSDGSVSNMVQFTVQFPSLILQSWTSIDKVIGEVPSFTRGVGAISDDNIRTWIKSIAQTVSACLLRRGLPMDPTQWQQPSAQNAYQSPVDVLEMITRYGAAARLAAAVQGQFGAGSGEWSLSKNLDAAYTRELKLLSGGDYDKLFLPAAATVESGQLVSVGDVFRANGESEQAFRKDQVF